MMRATRSPGTGWLELGGPSGSGGLIRATLRPWVARLGRLLQATPQTRRDARQWHHCHSMIPPIKTQAPSAPGALCSRCSMVPLSRLQYTSDTGYGLL